MATVPRWFGYNPPFIGGQQNVMSRQEDLRLIKNDMLQLLLTSPGERVYRPDFGTPIRRTVFDQATAPVVDNLIADIESIIENEEPRLTNVQVYITLKKDDLEMDITVIGFLTNDPNVQFELELNLPFSAGTVAQQEVATGLTQGNEANTGSLSTRAVQ